MIADKEPRTKPREQAIDSAPKDGSAIRAKRLYNGKTIWEGECRWGPMATTAPMRFESPGGLDGPLPGDNEYADVPGWCTLDGRYHVPTPTHWYPA